MGIEAILGFSAAMFVLAIVPGPGVFATVSQALSSGFRAALDLIAGIILGDIIFLLLAVLGLSAIAHALGDFFTIVKWAGGAYLIWIGLSLWLHPPAAYENLTPEARRSGWQRFLSGLFITLGNPKAILFYAGFLPTFLDLTRMKFWDVVTVAGIVALVLAGVMAGYAFSAARARQVFTGSRARRRLNRGAGTVMIGAGVLIVTR